MYNDIKEKINLLIGITKERCNDLNMGLVASVKEETLISSDYKIHSVTTSYLSFSELQEILEFIREFNIYTKVFYNTEDILKEILDSDNKINIIFETSSKGNGKGRDALMPAISDLLGIKHVGPNPTVNAICSSKFHWTSILSKNGIKTPKSYFYNNGWITIPEYEKKYILKLNYECASIGLFSDSVMINDGNNIDEKAKFLYENFNQAIICQEFIDGYEVEVPIVKNKNFEIVFPPIGLKINDSCKLKNKILDYDDIYSDEYSTFDFMEHKPKIAKKIMEICHKIIETLDLNGYMRIDFRIKENGDCYVIDINNDPCINSCGSFLASLNILEYEKKYIIPIIIGNALI